LKQKKKRAVASKPAVTQPPLSGRRRRLFALMAVALPLVLVGLLEGGLRLGGYGYDPAFFQMAQDGSGNKVLRNNDSFMFRFFPPELARWPASFNLAADKPADVRRIFIFGESAAMGDPQPSVGPSHILEVLLRERFPDQKFEVVNLGITAINSHVILPLARDVAARGQGDIWLVYMGNNEMVGPFGAASAFGARAVPRPVVRLNLALQKTRVGQFATSLLRKLDGKSPKPSWGGMEMFLQNQIPPDDPRRETVYRNFDRNLRDLVRAGQAGGARVVLCTVSVNLRDCPPFASHVNNQLPAAERKQFEALYVAAVRHQTNQQYIAAAALFAQAARLDPQHAGLQFRWASCLLNQANPNAARDHFQQACDVDALPFRADTRINAAIRSLAQERAGANLLFCDAEAAIAGATDAVIAGDESFFEHVHFNFDGNYRLARVWAEHIAQILPDDVTSAAASADWASQEFCERAIGLSDWNRALIVGSVLARMQLPPLADQINNVARTEALKSQLGILAERQRQTGALAQAQADFIAAIARAPEDTLLLENHAKFLESIGDRKGALAEYVKITHWLPHDFHAGLQAGRLFGQLKNWPESERLLRWAAMQRPTLPDPWFELGVVLAAQNNHREALECFNQVAQMHPSDPTCLIYQARMLSKLDRRAEAMQHYRKSIALEGSNWNAHLELAEELVVANRADEAIKEYQEAVRLNPRHPVMHINLGVLLARQNRLDEAIGQFESALRLDPGNATAREYLQQVGARRQREGK
jgi:tetratricopeptide (TPR) repeat protein